MIFNRSKKKNFSNNFFLLSLRRMRTILNRICVHIHIRTHNVQHVFIYSQHVVARKGNVGDRGGGERSGVVKIDDKWIIESLREPNTLYIHPTSILISNLIRFIRKKAMLVCLGLPFVCPLLILNATLLSSRGAILNNTPKRQNGLRSTIFGKNVDLINLLFHFPLPAPIVSPRYHQQNTSSALPMNEVIENYCFVGKKNINAVAVVFCISCTLINRFQNQHSTHSYTFYPLTQ